MATPATLIHCAPILRRPDAAPAVRLRWRAARRHGCAVTAGVALLAAALAAHGQMPGDSRRGSAASPAARAAPPAAAEPRVQVQNLAELVHLRLAQLEEDLNLRPEQWPLWSTYRDRVLRMLDDTRRIARATAATAKDVSAPQRLDLLADAARHRLAAVEDIIEAGKALYASLAAPQREVADRRLALPLATLLGTDAAAAAPRRQAAPPRTGDAYPAEAKPP
jgi:hypothetical protein